MSPYRQAGERPEYPPEPAPKAERRSWEGVVFAAIAAVVLPAHFTFGCALFARPEAAEAAYTSEHLRCVDDARTLAESHACRDAVDRRWGIQHTLRDAGGDR